MIASINQLLENINEKYPEWDEGIVEMMSGEDETIKENDLTRMFTELLKKVLQLAKKEEDQVRAINIIDTCFASYKTHEYVVRYVKQMLAKFHRMDPLRELERTDIYKAKSCVDHILERYVVRYDPYFDTKENGFFGEKEYKNVAIELDRIVEICVEFNLYLSAMSKRIEEETGLTPSFCDYIAAKIDASLDKLKLTYLVCKLRGE